jgi:hypothetical protein
MSQGNRSSDEARWSDGSKYHPPGGTSDQQAKPDGDPAPARFGRKTFAVLWVVTLVIGAVSLGLLYQDDAAWANKTATALLKVDGLDSQNTALQAKNSALTTEAAHPTLSTWNSCGSPCTLSPGGFREGTVPDAFTYHLKIHSDVMVYYAFLSLSEFTRFSGCPGSVYANDRSVNRLVVCVSYWIFNNNAPSDRTGAGLDINTDFHLGEGCASYVSVLMPFYANQTAQISPAVGVTYNPAVTSTGVCAG